MDNDRQGQPSTRPGTEPYVPERFAFEGGNGPDGTRRVHRNGVPAPSPQQGSLPAPLPAPAQSPYAPPAQSPYAPPAQSPYAPAAQPPYAPAAQQPARRSAPMAPGGGGGAAPPLVGLGDDAASAEAYRRASTEEELAADDLDLSAVLGVVVDRGASDLHLTVAAPPMIRLHGELVPVEGYQVLTRAVTQRVLYSILTQKQRERFEEELELDFSYTLPGRARFRVNLYRQRESVGAAFRMIPYEIKDLNSLGIPPAVANLARLPRGMVLVTGPTGSGKSTTLAALVDLANQSRREHIMTVEDPIEFLHKHKRCLVNQREVGDDTRTFASALKHALRQDPDIILVGEMRDLETISVALTAAETGHLVYATLHTQDAAQTIDRVIDVFPPFQQQQVRVQLAGAIQAVVCQALCRTADGHGRVAATEVLVATPAIRNLIREGKTHQIYSSMQAGAQHGMHTMDQHLAELVRMRRITYETGFEKCHHVEDFHRLTGRG